MIFLHTAFVTGSYHANFSPAYSFIVMDVLGRPYAAVVFMFCMGVGVVYSRHSQWDTMVKRGITLFLLGIFVNLCEFFIPYFAAGELSVNSHPFNIVGGLMLFCDDILAFAGWAFIFMGILKKFDVSNKKLIIIAVVMSIIGILLKDVDFGIPYVNLLLANFIGCKGGFGAFPLLNWFIFPVVGYVWGQYFIRAKDKGEFFKFWPILFFKFLIKFLVRSCYK